VLLIVIIVFVLHAAACTRQKMTGRCVPFSVAILRHMKCAIIILQQV